MKDKINYTGVDLMATAPVGIAIIRLALPMMIAMLAQANERPKQLLQLLR
jgi:hypothetical protein